MKSRQIEDLKDSSNNSSKDRSLRVLFMGTPEFAVASLDAINHSNHKIIGVVTIPDKTVGRGLKLTESAVKKYAEKHCLPLLQPEKLKNIEFLTTLKELDPDVIVVVAFRMLPKEVWSLPKNGTFNLHASLLPQYRGAAPINHAIINGEKETGVSTFFINENIDTGEILLQKKIPILSEDCAGDIHDRLMDKGKQLVLETLDRIADHSIISIPQTLEESLKTAPKIYKEDCLIDWNSPLIKIHNLIRGLSPYPGAFTYLLIDDKTFIFKIFSGTFELKIHQYPVGKVIIEDKLMKISTEEGFYLPEVIQPEGKKKMDVRDFINGIKSKEIMKIKI